MPSSPHAWAPPTAIGWEGLLAIPLEAESETLTRSQYRLRLAARLAEMIRREPESNAAMLRIERQLEESGTLDGVIVDRETPEGFARSLIEAPTTQQWWNLNQWLPTEPQFQATSRSTARDAIEATDLWGWVEKASYRPTQDNPL